MQDYIAFTLYILLEYGSNNIIMHDQCFTALVRIQVNGVKGPSWLTVVPSFDLIQGMSFDYMHCVLLGVCRFLLSLWLQPSHHQQLYYIGTSTSDLDARLLSIRPPNEMQRTPRSVASTLKYWKGALVCLSADTLYMLKCMHACMHAYIYLTTGISISYIPEMRAV